MVILGKSLFNVRQTLLGYKEELEVLKNNGQANEDQLAALKVIKGALNNLTPGNITKLFQDENKLSQLIKSMKTSFIWAESLPSPTSSSSFAQQIRRRTLSSSLKHARGILLFGSAVSAKQTDEKPVVSTKKKRSILGFKL